MLRKPLSHMFLVPLLLMPVTATSAQAQVTDIRYELVFNAETALTRTAIVGMMFTVAAAGPVELSLPAWTPGAYEISNFARNVRSFEVAQGGRALRWEKADPDTWRVQATGAGTVQLRFEFLADSLDNAMAWARPDFLMINGTNAFLYPEGIGFDFPATVTVSTEADWQVATGMRLVGPGRVYREQNYHDLVDQPFFIGRIDLDGTTVGGKSWRIASWPAGRFGGRERSLLHQQISDMVPTMARVFGETPWEDYTTLLIFDEEYSGGSALEHQNSHIGIYHPNFIGTPLLASITGHEIFHAWNVKRLRPADLTPYRYDAAQPTPWLWVSEGITDYYADLTLMRGAVVDSTMFLSLLSEKLAETDATPPVALEDASLSAWIHPTDGTDYVYYPKGALAGFLLDILIRDASDNTGSLDDVMRSLYQTTWKAGRGFTAADWSNAIRTAAGGREFFGDFYHRFVDGREPFPWHDVLPMAGLQLVTETARDPRIGLSSSTDAGITIVMEVVPGSAAADAGVLTGDFLISVGEVTVIDDNFGFLFRARYADAEEGDPLAIVVQRGEARLTLQGELRFEESSFRMIALDPAAPAKAQRIRSGIFRGRPA